MFILSLLVSVHFITVHTPDGQAVEVNVAEISTLREPKEAAHEHFAKGSNCVIIMTNGKFTLTIEPCVQIVDTVVDMLKNENK